MEIKNESEAKQIIKQILLYKAKLEPLIASIRAYCDLHDTIVEHDGKAWGFHDHSTQGFYDTEKFLKRVGSNGWKYCNVDNRKAKMLFPMFPDLLTTKTRREFKGKEI